MKKLVLLALTAASFASANAQVNFGIKAGANFATLTGSGVSNVSTLTDFHGGGFAHIPLFNTFYLQPEIMYSGEGAKTTQSGMDFTLNQGYLNVPVLFQYRHSSGFLAETGPQIGFLLSAKVKSGGQSEDVKSEYNSTDFSWAFGLGYYLSSVHAGIDARYNLGLTNIAAHTTNNETVMNSVIQVGLFYIFGAK